MAHVRKKGIISLFFLLLMILVSCSSCGSDINKRGKNIIHVMIGSEPEGSEVYWRIISNVPEVRSTNRFFLGRTPYRETRNLKLPGLSQENAKQVYIVVEVEKKGYHQVIERFNMASVLSTGVLNIKYPLHAMSPDMKNQMALRGNKPLPRPKPNFIKPDKKLTFKKPEPKKEVVPVIKNTPIPVDKADDFEPNDEVSQAKSIYLLRVYQANFHKTSDVDHYLIFLGEKPTYTLDIKGLNPGASLDLELLTYPGKGKRVLRKTSRNGKLNLSFRLGSKRLKTGIYLLKLKGNGKKSPYQMKIQVKRK